MADKEVLFNNARAKVAAAGFTARSFTMVAVLSVVASQSLACKPSSVSPRSSALLGTVDSFAVLGGSTVTNTGPTTIAGNLGVSPGLAVTGFPPGLVTGGVIHAGDAVALQAQRDVTTAYDRLAGEACAHDLTGQDLGGLTLTPGVYCFSSSAQLTGALTLDAQGNPDSMFVFQIGSTLTTATNASVLMINGAQGCNAFWQVGSSATLGTTTTFVGSILALTSITLTTGVQLFGRALARNGAVTMDTSNVEMKTCTDAVVADGGSTDGASSGGPSLDATASDDDGASNDGASNDGPSNDGPASNGPASDGPAGGCRGACMVCKDTVVDLETDRNNCGGCGNHCAWNSQCVAGACTCTATTCGNICVKLDENPKNCGACGNVCAANQWCDQGTCTAVCAGTICDSWCTNTMTNEDACGACGNKCGAAESCESGICVCAGAMCGSACVDVSSSASNCGACGHACGETECCTDGQCVPR
jgi:hypothetical protein